MGDRMRNHFDEMLEQLNIELMNMGALCEDAIEFSVQMLSEAEDKENKVALIEEEINAMERKIESMCMKLLLRQQPVAKDLRQISAALKMISDMERIGDQALDISELARFINRNQNRNTKLYEMAQATISMVTRAIESFVKKDLSMAREVMDYDDVVDDLFAEVKKEVIEEICEKEGDGEYLADVLMAAKYLERIGDHAVNIGEWVEYSITGIHASGKFEK